MDAEAQQRGGAPPPGLRIRRGIPEDAERVAAIQVTSWRVGYAGLLPDTLLAGLSVEARTAAWRSHLETTARGLTLIATSHDEETVHGFTTLGPSRDGDATAGTGELWALYTHPNAWDRGVGGALLRSATSQLRALGFSRATLWVLTGNGRARRFYERRGWQPDGLSRVDRRADVGLDEVRYGLADLTLLT